jgi:hypothetical protein
MAVIRYSAEFWRIYLRDESMQGGPTLGGTRIGLAANLAIAGF